MWWESLLAEDVKCFPLKHGPLFLSPLSPETDEQHRTNKCNTYSKISKRMKKETKEIYPEVVEMKPTLQKRQLGTHKNKIFRWIRSNMEVSFESNDAEYPKVQPHTVLFRRKGILFIDCRTATGNWLEKKFYQQFSQFFLLLFQR